MLHVTVHISEGLSWRVEARAHNERDDGSWELLAEQTYWPTLPPNAGDLDSLHVAAQLMRQWAVRLLSDHPNG